MIIDVKNAIMIKNIDSKCRIRVDEKESTEIDQL